MAGPWWGALAQGESGLYPQGSVKSRSPENREYPVWASNRRSGNQNLRPLQAKSSLLFFFSQRLLISILLTQLSAGTLSAFNILLQLWN
jgi:hypothetical protein